MISSRQTRRGFLRSVAIAAALAPASRLTAEGSADKPNIVLILADDIGYECLGCYGTKSYKTPNLDKLAAEGMRFDHCYAQPLCTPSRVKMMTGKYNFRNYVNFGVLDPKEKTFAQMLSKAGYRTCVVGKWQLYGSVNQAPKVRGTGSTPEQAGFDEYCLWQIRDRGSRYKNPIVNENSMEAKILKGKYGPDVWTDYALGFIERNRDRRFLLYFPMALVHDPFQPTPDSADWSQNKPRSSVKYFGDMVEYMDKIVGRIVSRLDELKLRRNTLIIFVGDNGTSSAVTTRTTHGDIRGAKGDTTDAGMRVPMIAAMDGVVPAGSVCDDLVDFSDYLPTLAEAARTNAPGPVDGVSFWPQLNGRKGNPREWLFCHYEPNWGKWKGRSRFVRNKRFKLYDDGRFYDISRDVLEKNPIPADTEDPACSAARKSLQRVLDSIR